MNRKRCPWCGKIIDKNKDKIFFRDVFFSPSVPLMLLQANCSHCGHKYGQAPIFSYVLIIVCIILLSVVLAFVFQSALLLFVAALSCALFCFMPYSKLDDEGKTCEENTDLLCKFVIIDKFDKIKRGELYFLNNRFDDFEPFVLASPVSVYSVSKKSNMVFGEFLYMNEKNGDYLKKDSCELYDTQMNLIAKIKFIKDVDTNS